MAKKKKKNKGPITEIELKDVLALLKDGIFAVKLNGKLEKFALAELDEKDVDIAEDIISECEDIITDITPNEDDEDFVDEDDSDFEDEDEADFEDEDDE